MSPRAVTSRRASASMAVGFYGRMIFQAFAGIRADRGGAGVNPDIRAPATVAPKLDVFR